jgi:aspartate/methionine/tyrosine aminotransferase
MNLPPFKLERYFAKYEFTTRYLLCSSDCESLTIQDLLALEPEGHERFESHWLGYTESQGAPTLRQEICRLYETIQPDEVLVTSGAQEAIFLLMHGVLQPGDHVIVHWPCYQSLMEIARSIGCEVSLWRASEQNEWMLDLDKLKHLIRSNTRIVVINTPHNPTGYLMSLENFQELNRIAGENNILLFSDEVYRESEHSPKDRLPAACDLDEHAVSLGVMSKTYGLPGLRIGWIATRNTDLINRMALLKDYTTICNGAPGEFLAELALRHRQRLIDRNLTIIHSNLTLLDNFFARHNDRFLWRRPRAGPIAFPRFIGEDIGLFCQELAAKAGVMLLPGTVFDDTGNHFRIGFGRKDLPDALERFEEFLQEQR